MTHPDPIILQGIHGSPYTRKMLAVLRFRHLPYRYIVNWPQNGDIPGNGPDRQHLPHPKVPLLPTVYLSDADGTLEAVTDTTPIIRRLETAFQGRGVIPDDPVLAFINYVLEDYADEWLTRCMFHYRWSAEEDIAKAGRVLPLYLQVDKPDAALDAAAADFTKRQVDRLHVVGSNPQTAPVIAASYQRFLQLLEAHLQTQPFLFGGRPASADFAMMGQLTCLAHFDPTPRRMAEQQAPRVYAWGDRLEDLSGYDVTPQDWSASAAALPATLAALLEEVARTHMPQLIANARAVIAGQPQFTTRIDGCDWSQPSFPYQLKCLRWTREEYAALSPADQGRARSILDGAGLSPLIDAGVTTD